MTRRSPLTDINMLPTCPSCGQSVLDDDATDCPFCGASMSGKGKKKPAPAAAQKQPSATAGKKPKPKPPKKKDKDDPFDAAPVKTTSAVQASPKPMKGRLHKVVCPMCDAPGFIPKKAAGRDVRCANKKCMVPVFKSPAIQRHAETAPEPESGSSLLPIIIGAVALAIVGGVLFVMFGQKPTPNTVNKGPAPAPVTPTEDTLEKYLKDREKPVEETAQTKSLAGLQMEILELLAETAAKSGEDKPFCRLMTAEAYAAAGNTEQAVSQLDLIARSGSPQFYQRALALTQISAAHLAAGDKAKAAEVAKQAVDAATSMPQFGQTEFEVRTEVACALIRAGEMDAAVGFVNASGRDLSDPLTYRSAVAAAARTIAYSSADAVQSPTVPSRIGNWTNPMWVAVAMGLSIHGQGTDAVAWSQRADNKAVRIDSLASVAAIASATGNSSVVVGSAITSAAKDGAEATTRVNAAAAFGAVLGKQPNAATLLAAAEKSAADIPKPQPVIIPNARELYDYSLPDDQSAHIAAFAMAELARAQAEVNGGGADTLQTALSHTHTYCPAPDFIQARMEENLTASQLAGALKISPAEARTALNKFRSKIKNLQKVCEERTRLQAEILAQASTSKLADAVWALADPQAGENILSTELLADSSLPWRVALGYLKSGRTAKGREIVGKLDECGWPVIKSQLDSFTNPDQSPAMLAASLSPYGEREPVRLATVLDAVNRLMATGVKEATLFAKSVGNPLWQRDALRIAGTLAAKSGKGRELIEFVKDLDLESPGRTAIYRGFVSGIAMDSNFESSP